MIGKRAKILAQAHVEDLLFFAHHTRHLSENALILSLFRRVPTPQWREAAPGPSPFSAMKSEACRKGESKTALLALFLRAFASAHARPTAVLVDEFNAGRF